MLVMHKAYITTGLTEYKKEILSVTGKDFMVLPIDYLVLLLALCSMILLLVNERSEMHLQSAVIVRDLTQHFSQPLILRVHPLQFQLHIRQLKFFIKSRRQNDQMRIIINNIIQFILIK